ncbi:MAG: MCE family protein [Sedimentisphaerales bacterium]|nr:MCE family protein [Sedimentisphaerales bacterium]
MSTKPHYFRIGIFVILAVALIVVAVILFGAGLLAHDEMHFESYYSESITGLSIGSAVEFRGVHIGHVSGIGFVGNTYALSPVEGAVSPYASYVRVVSAVPRSRLPNFAVGQVETILEQMVARGLRARIASNLLTGQAYLELNYVDPNRFPVEPLPWKARYLRIPTAPSDLSTIKDSIDNILNELQSIDVSGLAKSLDSVLVSLNRVITEANVAELSRSAQAMLMEIRHKVAALETEKISSSTQEFLASLNTAVTDANVPGLSQDARALLTDLRATSKYLNALLAPPEWVVGRPNVPELVARLNTTIAQLDRLISSERPQIDMILTEFQRIADNLNDLVSALKEQPSSLLFGGQPPKSKVLK